MPREVRIGLDIGTSAVRAAEISEGGSTPRLRAVGQVPLPPQSVVDGVVMDLDVVESAIRRLWKQGRFGSTRVHIGVSGNRAVARRAEVGPIPDSELAASVRFLAEEIVPQFAPEESFLSPLAVGEVAGESPRRRVLVAAAHRDLVMSRVEVATRAGLQVVGVDLGPASLARTFPAEDPGRPEAVVVVGSGQSSVVVHRAGLPLLVRTVPVAGAALTAAVAGRLGLAVEDAEAVKRGRAGTAAVAAEAAEAMAPVIASIVGEMQAAIDLFTHEEGEPVARVLLTGGATRLSALAEAFARTVPVPVAMGQVSAGVDTRRCGLDAGAFSELDAVLAVPVGLALRGHHRFDLLPDEVRQRNALKRTKQTLMAIGGVAVVLLAGATVARAHQVAQTRRDLGATQSEVATLNSRIGTFNDVVATSSRLASKRAQVTGTLAPEVDWPAVFDELSRRMPADVALTSISGQLATPTTGSTSSSGMATTTSSSATTSAGATTGTTPGGTLPAASQVVATLTVSGSAKDFRGGAQWILDLSASPAFDDVFVSSLSRGAGSSGSTAPATAGVSFSSTLDVTGAAHSTRYDHYKDAGQ